MGNQRHSFEIRTLGSFNIKIDGQTVPINRWKSKKALMLFKYLVAKQGEKVPRDVLIDLLWPDWDLESSKHNLHTTIYNLRRSIESDSGEESPIRYCCGLYWFEAPQHHFLDIQEFEHLIKESTRWEDEDPFAALSCCQAALELYKGDFLAEDLYEEWTIPIREGLREQYFSLVLRAAELQVRCNQDYSTAVSICRNALALDNTREELHQAVISYLIAQNRYAEAITQYNACAKILEEEFELEPNEETHALIAKIKSAPSRRTVELIKTSEKEAHEGARIFTVQAFHAAVSKEQKVGNNMGPTSVLLMGLSPSSKCGVELDKQLQYLRKSLRQVDIICPWTTGNVAILLPSTDRKGAEAVSARLQRQFGKIDPNITVEYCPITLQEHERLRELMNSSSSSLLTGAL